MRTAGDKNHRPYVAHDRKLTHQWARVDIGATGAPTIAEASADFAITRTGPGTYDLAFNPGVGGLHPWVALKSAAKTVTTYVVTAYSPTAGTATIKTLLGSTGADTDPANGDAISIFVDVLPHKDI